MTKYPFQSPTAKETVQAPKVLTVRRYEPVDRAAVWSLDHFPFKGATADPTYPLDLPEVDDPGQFDDLADGQASFIDQGGEFLIVLEDRRVMGIGGYRIDGGGAKVLRVRVHPALRRRGIGHALMEPWSSGRVGPESVPSISIPPPTSLRRWRSTGAWAIRRSDERATVSGNSSTTGRRLVFFDRGPLRRFGAASGCLVKGRSGALG